MTRRSKSPLKAMKYMADIVANPQNQIGQRQLMIMKLKQDLILARGRQKQCIITQQYLKQKIDNAKILQTQRNRALNENKIELDINHKKISEEKLQLQKFKLQLKTCYQQQKQTNDAQAQYKILLSDKSTQVQKLRKQAIYLQGENFELLNERYRLQNQSQAVNEELRRITSTKNDKDGRIREINNKIGQVRIFIQQLKDQNISLKSNLKKYQNQNNGLSDNLSKKEDNIEILQENFSQKHDQIKNQIEKFIQLTHVNQKYLRQAQHNTNLLKKENEKNKQLNNLIKQTEILNVQKKKDVKQTNDQSNQIKEANNQLDHYNQKMKKDLSKCQQHFQNLLKQNILMQNQMEKYIQQDNHIINTIRKKQLLPTLDYMRALRSSRAMKDSTIHTQI